MYSHSSSRHMSIWIVFISPAMVSSGMMLCKFYDMYTRVFVSGCLVLCVRASKVDSTRLNLPLCYN